LKARNSQNKENEKVWEDTWHLATLFSKYADLVILNTIHFTFFKGKPEGNVND